MIRVDGQDRGKALYKKFPEKIKSMVMSQKTKYHHSQAYKGIRNFCREMDMYIDNDSNAVSSFVSDITPPTIRRGYNEYSALFHKFLETDPLFSVVGNERLSEDQISAVQLLINDNMDKTYYREQCLLWTIDDIIRYGTAGVYSFAANDYNANMLMTVKNEDGYGSYSQQYSEGESAVISTAIHPVNIIIDPRANFQSAYEFLGFVGDICLSKVKMLEDNDSYIGETVKKAFKKVKEGYQDNYFYTGPDNDYSDYTKGHGTICYLWTKLPIEGNEDDPTWYAIEEIAGEIIRIEESNLDDGVIPIALPRIFPRKYQWYGNTPLADKVCVQNMQEWLINTMAESTARMMDRMVLYREGSLDVEAINARHQTGGLVPYSGQETDLSKIMYGVQMPSVGFRENDWMMQEMRREDQETSMIPNFNPQSQGGPTNKTLGGAQMMASIGEMRASYLVNQMCVGLKDVAKHHMVIHRNIMEDKIRLSTGQEVPKDMFIGKDISFSVKISNVFNYIINSVDSANRLQMAINRRATGIPQFNTVKLGPLIEDDLRNSLKREDIEEYIDKDTLNALDDNDINMAKQAIQPQQPQAVPGTPGMPQQPTPDMGIMQGEPQNVPIR